MGSSLNTETELRELAEKFNSESMALQEAADVLQNMREQQELRSQEVNAVKNRVKMWLK